MITPIDFQVEDFMDSSNQRVLDAINAEALHGSELVDNLILLKFCGLYDVQQVLKIKYSLPFAWLNVDPTPAEYKEIAEKHGVIIERGQSVIVYIPLGAIVDNALLQIDIPQYQISYCFIADCNYHLLQNGLSANFLSMQVANFRPLLVFKRLVMDCLAHAGTDLHFMSFYTDKHPTHAIRYRVKGKLEDSEFKIDLPMIQQIMQAVIGKLSPASVMDLDSAGGVVTGVPDLFKDGTCELRITAMRVSAGMSADVTIQTTDTTTLTIDELGFPKSDVEFLRQLARRRSGLILVTGRPRTGKNTTMFAMLNEIVQEPIKIMEYSHPIENRMPYEQVDYKGNVELLREYMEKAKKQDIDIAILNEIPNADVAFAIRDLVNSSIGVFTTTHLNRVWHLPNKLYEFFGKDYKTIISQLNAVVNHKMFRRWKCDRLVKRTLVKEHGEFEMFCYAAGVRQYFVPADGAIVQYDYQPLMEALVITDSMKTSMLNFEELWRAEQMLELQIKQQHATLENKVAEYINEGHMSLEEMRQLF